MRWKLNPSVRYRVLDGEAIAVHQRAGEVLGLDPVGTRIFELLEAGATLSELRARLQCEYEAEATALESDLRAFLEELVAAGVVETEAIDP